MLLPHATLIAVIDGSEFELYRNTGTEAEPELTPEESPKLDGSNHSGGSHRSSSGECSLIWGGVADTPDVDFYIVLFANARR